jgi:leucyl-tRNA synthetase
VAQEEVEAFAHDAEEVEKWLKEKELKRIIYVPNKLINFVV